MNLFKRITRDGSVVFLLRILGQFSILKRPVNDQLPITFLFHLLFSALIAIRPCFILPVVITSSLLKLFFKTNSPELEKVQ